MNIVRHKCFISYHHADQDEVNAFVSTYGPGLFKENGAFIPKGLGRVMSDEIINSDDPDYVMRRIRELYLDDSTVTIVLMGKCTWARRYVDWEIQSSLRSGQTITPNGLLGIKLPSFPESEGVFPDRFSKNLNGGKDQNYAGWISYPNSVNDLMKCIKWAHARRTTHAKYIVNTKDRFSNNRKCE